MTMKKLLRLVAEMFRRAARAAADKTPSDPVCRVDGKVAPGLQAILGRVYAPLGGGWLLRELTIWHIGNGVTTVSTGKYLIGPQGHAWAWHPNDPVQWIPSPSRN